MGKTFTVRGTCADKPTIDIVYFSDTSHILLALEGTKPFFRDKMPLKDVKNILYNAGYDVEIINKDDDKGE